MSSVEPFRVVSEEDSLMHTHLFWVLRAYESSYVDVRFWTNGLERLYK